MRTSSVFYGITTIGLLFGNAHLAAQPSELHELFYHDASQAGTTLELGKIVLYFSTRPEVHVASASSGNEKKISFSFHSVSCAQAVFDAIRQFNQRDKKICKADLVLMKNGHVPAVLHVTYNPEKVSCTYDFFDSIKLRKGFVCTLYNRPLLDALSGEKKPILRTTCHNQPGVILDMGHGGYDTGALSDAHMPEKELTLSVGKRLASLLREQGFAVFCTRFEDTFVPLDTRTAFANQCTSADIVVSLHANSGGPSACGVETFCYKPTGEIHLANSDQHKVCIRDHDARRYQHSFALAECVHNAFIDQIKKNNISVVNRGIKHGTAQVLLGTVKPAIIVEMGFMTHPIESKFLASPQGQSLIAYGMCAGICAYFEQQKKYGCV